MHRQLVVLVASIVLLGISSTYAANWAVLVAGSNGYYNYRHQSDVCHAYQILHKNGIPDSNIVVMMYDDIAQNSQNPTKGIIINHPNGQDVYKGVPHDYIGKDVTPKNFINVLLGNKEAMNGVGSGKVLESGPDDNVFIYYTDHGAVGLVAFPTGVLYAKDLNDTITKMYTEKKYKEMVVYIESCESGSMVEGLLPNNINVYSTTASNAEESSYACYYDDKRGTYLGDVYSVVWMEDSDAEKIDQESLFKQFTVTKAKTNTSHVMQYGDLALGKEHNVSEFQGEAMQSLKPIRNIIADRYNDLLKRDAVATEDVRLSIVTRRLAVSPANSAEKAALERELVQLLNDRSAISTRINQIASVSLSINRGDIYETVTQKRMKLTQHDCYISATQHIHEKCFDLQNEYVLNKLWIVANLCQIGLQDFTINQAVDHVCNTRLHFDY
jgi:legumain